MHELQGRLQQVDVRIERGLGSAAEEQRFGSWRQRISEDTAEMENEYAAMLIQ
jgi:hypothetical protein